jgi:glutaconyl-CoA/methylmalonyl-CoA decarboxylase subunit gamma
MKYIVTLNNKRYEVEIERGQAKIVNTTEVAADAAKSAVAPVVKPQAVQSGGAGETVKCPMPGTIFDIKVAQGTAVKAGDVILVLEAMKMENEITAPKDGVVVQISVAKGASVNTGDVLAVIQ